MSSLTYNDTLAIAVSRSRCQMLYRYWQDKNLASGREQLDIELEEYARALHQLPEDVWPKGKHDPDLQQLIEGWQSEVDMLYDDATALYGGHDNSDDGDGKELVGV